MQPLAGKFGPTSRTLVRKLANFCCAPEKRRRQAEGARLSHQKPAFSRAAKLTHSP